MHAIVSDSVYSGLLCSVTDVLDLMASLRSCEEMRIAMWVASFVFKLYMRALFGLCKSVLSACRAHWWCGFCFQICFSQDARGGGVPVGAQKLNRLGCRATFVQSARGGHLRTPRASACIFHPAPKRITTQGMHNMARQVTRAKG